MQLTVNSQDLAIELRLLNKIVPKQPALPVRAHALLDADGTVVKLHGTDQEIGLRTECAALVVEPGQVVLPVARTLAMVEQFPNADVTITTEKTLATIRCGSYTSKMSTLRPEDAFALPPVEGTSSVLNSALLADAINRTRHAVSTSDAKHVLQGALLTTSNGRNLIVATDAKRFALSAWGANEPMRHHVIPVKTLDLLAFGIGAGDITMTASDRHLFFTLGERTLVSSIPASQFPKYQPIIDGTKQNTHVVAVDRVAISAAVKRVNLSASTETRTITVETTPGALHLSSRSTEAGEASESVLAGYDGPALKFATNGEHLLDFLESSSASTIHFCVKDAKAALLLTTDAGDHFGVLSMVRA